MADTPIRIGEDRPEAVAASALLQERLIEAAWELRWAQEAYEPGEVLEPFPRVLTDALARFLDLAPALVAYVRGPQTAKPSAHAELLLDYFETSLELALQSDSYAMALWFTEGEQLIGLAQTAAETPAARTPRPVPAAGPLQAPLSTALPTTPRSR